SNCSCRAWSTDPYPGRTPRRAGPATAWLSAMRRLAAVAVRRSIGLMACPALLVLVGLHIFGRSRPWEHEWLWAIYQYHFSTVLLGPAAAGLAAWEGFRAQQAEDLLESS